MSLLVMEHVEHPFGKGDLTSDGVQYSDLHTTTTDDYEAVETVTIEPRPAVKFFELEVGLTCSIQSSSTTESVLFKWQARNKGGTYQDLHTEVTRAANASALAEYTYSGRIEAVAGLLDQLPIDVRLVIKSGGAGGETAKGKTKSSSYVKIVYPTT